MTREPTPPGVVALTEAVDALRSGARPDEAWQRIGVLVRDGMPTFTALREVTGDPELAAAVHAAARLAHELGAPAATVLDEVLRAAEDDADAAVRRDTAVAGPAASARVLGWLPAFGLAVGIALGTDPTAVLLDPDGGWVLLLAGVCVAVVGHRWTAHLVRVAATATWPDTAVRPRGTGWPGTPVRSRRTAQRGSPVRPRRTAQRGSPVAPRRVTRPEWGSVAPPRRRLSALATALPAGSDGAGPAGLPGAPGTVRIPLVLDLLAAAAESGAAVPRSLSAVGAAVGGSRGVELSEAGAELGWGAGWDEAWSGRDPGLAPVARALRPAWEDGASPVAGTRAAARAIRRAQHAAAMAAAERLGVRLLLPLALCHLPAFVLVGIVPVLVSLVASGAGT